MIADLNSVSDKKRAVSVSRYFKTGKGEYGEGDLFIGISVPQIRAVSGKYLTLQLPEVKKLLVSKIHEHRFAALVILCLQYEKIEEKRKEIFEVYLKHTRFINNWDLVDVSAREIVGHYVWNYFNGSKRRLFLSKLARSSHLWERRIAMVSTYYGIGKGDFKETYLIAELLLKDSHDLMHKAAGWMLREAGKKDRLPLVKFLERYGAIMPRTMLRYALEHFRSEDKVKYMQMKALSLPKGK